MGRTIPSFRMALEFEIENWKDFRRALQTQEQRKAFDELMDMCRNNAMAAGCACNPIVFEPMVMSILLAQQKRIIKLEKELEAIAPKPDNPSGNQERSVPIEPNQEQTVQVMQSGGEQKRLY